MVDVLLEENSCYVIQDKKHKIGIFLRTIMAANDRTRISEVICSTSSVPKMWIHLHLIHVIFSAQF